MPSGIADEGKQEEHYSNEKWTLLLHVLSSYALVMFSPVHPDGSLTTPAKTFASLCFTVYFFCFFPSPHWVKGADSNISDEYFD